MWFYRLLLGLYPAGFRAEYGAEMRAVFRDRLRAAGPAGRILVFLEALVDVLRHAVPLHLEVLRADLRWAFRSAVRAPGFAATVVLVSALGIGGATSVLTLADHVLLRPLPYPEADRLVRLWQNVPGYTRMEASPGHWRDWREGAPSLMDVGAYHYRSVNLVGRGEPVRLEGAAATPELLQALRVRPVLGRVFAPEDAPRREVLLTWPLWQTRFGGDPSVVGERVLLDDVPYEVIGVLPQQFGFPSRTTAFLTDLSFSEEDYGDRQNTYLRVVARLRPGATIERVRAEMSAIAARPGYADPDDGPDVGVTVQGMRDDLPRETRVLLIGLAVASLGLLLIAAANLANLCLSRALGRRRELAVRSWLGAGRARLVRQLLTESTVLAGVGGLLGIGLAHGAVPLMTGLIPAGLPVAAPPSIDLRILGMAFALTLLTGIGFGAAPALRLDAEPLRGAGRDRLRASLVVFEVAATVALLIAAGLLLRALGEVRRADPGFTADGVLTARTWLPHPRYRDVAARDGFYGRVLDDVRALPGVENAAYTSFLPIAFGGGVWQVDVAGDTGDPEDMASLRFVTSDYFATMEIPILRGRDVRDTDTQDAAYVALVSESFARRYWPGMDPLGRRLTIAFFERTIVGVVGDVRVRGLEAASEPQIYLPHRQVPDGGLPFYEPKDLVVRAGTDALALAPAVRRAVHAADPTQPVSELRLLTDIVETSTIARRVQVRALGALTALAFLLAAAGLHGLLSLIGSQRSKEIGVRMALGARRREIVWMMLRDAARLAAPGIALGGLLGYGAGRALAGLLAGVPAGDIVTFAAALAGALLMALLGSLQPALRAGRTDPNAVIRAS